MYEGTPHKIFKAAKQKFLDAMEKEKLAKKNDEEPLPVSFREETIKVQPEPVSAPDALPIIEKGGRGRGGTRKRGGTRRRGGTRKRGGRRKRGGTRR